MRVDENRHLVVRIARAECARAGIRYSELGDSLESDLVRFRVRARLRQEKPEATAEQRDELIEELLT